MHFTRKAQFVKKKKKKYMARQRDQKKASVTGVQGRIAREKKDKKALFHAWLSQTLWRVSILFKEK